MRRFVCSSSCATFDFASRCGVRLFLLKDRHQSITNSTNDLGVKIRKYVNFGDLGFTILFVGILSFYAINLGVVSLFADSSFTLLTMFVSNVIYRFE